MGRVRAISNLLKLKLGITLAILALVDSPRQQT
jgi:hypothetical protein